MSYIDDISRAALLLIRAGLLCRLVFCCVRMITADEEKAQYKRRIRNTLVFEAVAELTFVLKNIVIHYFS